MNHSDQPISLFDAEAATAVILVRSHGKPLVSTNDGFVKAANVSDPFDLPLFVVLGGEENNSEDIVHFPSVVEA